MDLEEDMYGAASGWVEARSSCDHLPSLCADLVHIPLPDTPCSRCEHPAENWLCLSCKEVLCSRFVNKHMLSHYQETGHSLALSFSDLSVWCFSCEAYLDVQLIRELHQIYEIAHLLKFGERPPCAIWKSNSLSSLILGALQNHDFRMVLARCGAFIREVVRTFYLLYSFCQVSFGCQVDYRSNYMFYFLACTCFLPLLSMNGIALPNIVSFLCFLAWSGSKVNINLFSPLSPLPGNESWDCIT